LSNWQPFFYEFFVNMKGFNIILCLYLVKFGVYLNDYYIIERFKFIMDILLFFMIFDNYKNEIILKFNELCFNV